MFVTVTQPFNMENYNLRELTEAYPSDPLMYNPIQEELEWLKKIFSIQDEEELKKYALEIQAEGLAVYPYPCLKKFTFTYSRVGNTPHTRTCLL
ncbi:hypothetical protein M422DRAFT_249920 [Sphaerobolus stellatus SS14]|nr:hypothetical protein M422DRAFT_249920 [Sphaerobolus stellatus SS14]